MRKMGRPLVEGEARTEEVKVRMTPTMRQRIEAKRGGQSVPDWVRTQIERGLR